MSPIYNSIGKTYDITRTADPVITAKISEFIEVTHSGKYLDIGCGTGNYTYALNQLDIVVDGIDISEEMLKKASAKYQKIMWYQGDARSLPFTDNCYNGAFCILATRHIGNFEKAFKEAFRVISDGVFIIFTSTPLQMQHYWLWHYFPEMLKASSDKMASFEEIELALITTGFKNIKQEPFFVTSELQDLFLHAGKYRPHIYLDLTVRQGISSFHLSAHKVETEIGLQKLQIDIDSGKIHEIIHKYESSLGDYCFIIGEK